MYIDIKRKNKFLNGIPRVMQGLLVTPGSHKIEGQNTFQLRFLKSWDQLEAMI